MSRLRLVGALMSLFILSGCASGTFKERQAQREQIANSTGMFCEFISGDKFPDLDVELSMTMGKRCDSSKNFSISPYRNSSAQNGIVYCCAMNDKKAAPSAAPSSKKSGSTAPVVGE